MTTSKVSSPKGRSSAFACTNSATPSPPRLAASSPLLLTLCDNSGSSNDDTRSQKENASDHHGTGEGGRCLQVGNGEKGRHASRQDESKAKTVASSPVLVVLSRFLEVEWTQVRDSDIHGWVIVPKKRHESPRSSADLEHSHTPCVVVDDGWSRMTTAWSAQGQPYAPGSWCVRSRVRDLARDSPV